MNYLRSKSDDNRTALLKEIGEFHIVDPDDMYEESSSSNTRSWRRDCACGERLYIRYKGNSQRRPDDSSSGEGETSQREQSHALLTISHTDAMRPKGQKQSVLKEINPNESQLN